MRAILTYHSFDTSGSPISCDPQAFDRHLAWLRARCIRVTSLDELLALPDSADAVALTFDDGFVNFREVAAPRLQANGWPATLFVVTDRVGLTNAWGGREASGIPALPLLGWDALASLADQGVTLGAHTRSHPDLVGAPASLVEDEVLGSAELIARRTGRQAAAFAYPYGRFDAQAVTIAARAFRHACTTEFRPLGRGVDAWRLPRLDMFYFQRPGALDQWGSGSFAVKVAARRALRRARVWATPRSAPNRRTSA